MKRKTADRSTKRNKGTIFFVLLVVSLFVLPFLIITAIKIIDKTNFCIFDWFRIDDGITVWFGFWGSYLGCIASIILSIVTFRVTQKIQNVKDQAEEKFKSLQLSDCLAKSLPHTGELHVSIADVSKGRYNGRISYINKVVFDLYNVSENIFYFKLKFEEYFFPFVDLKIEEFYLDKYKWDHDTLTFFTRENRYIDIFLLCKNKEEYAYLAKAYYHNCYSVTKTFASEQILPVMLKINCTQLLQEYSEKIYMEFFLKIKDTNDNILPTSVKYYKV